MALRKIGFFQADEDSNLPVELLVHILSQLTLKELLNARLVSQLFARLGFNNNVWAALFEKYFGVKISGACREKFILHYRCERIMEIASRTFSDRLDINDDMLEEAILREYNLLAEFAVADELGSDAIWTSYLRAKLLMHIEKLLSTAAFTLKKDFNRRHDFLNQAVRLGNPLAMLDVANIDCNVVEYFKYGSGLEAIKKSALFVTKARNSECLEVIYRLAKFYFEAANFSSKNYFELLIKAAKGGHAQAAYELALCYSATFEEQKYIPFGDNEWESGNLISKILEKMEAEVLTPEIVAKYRSKLITLAKDGALHAAYALFLFYEAGEPRLEIEPNYRLAIYYKEIVLKLTKASKPARKERALYWMEEAAKGGCVEAVCWLKGNEVKKEKEEKDISAPAGGYSPRR